MFDRPAAAWFAPNRYGYGIGTPICRQGRIALAAYVGISLGAGLVASVGGDSSHGSLALVIGAVAMAVLATMVFLIVATMKTAGRVHHHRVLRRVWHPRAEPGLAVVPVRRPRR